MFRISENTQYGIVCGVSVLSSTIGIAIAVLVTKDAYDGTRGAAIGTALTFGFMFLKRDHGAALYDALTHRLPNMQQRIQVLEGKAPKPVATDIATKVATLENEVDALVGAIGIDARGQRKLDRFLAFSAVISALLWGFGDLVAGALLP